MKYRNKISTRQLLSALQSAFVGEQYIFYDELCKPVLLFVELDVRCCRRIESSYFVQLSKLTRLHTLNLYRTVVDSHSLLAIVR